MNDPHKNAFWYSLPGESEFYHMALHSSDEGGNYLVVIQPFDNRRKAMMLCGNEKRRIEPSQIKPRVFKPLNESEPVSKKAYLEKVRMAIDACKKSLGKVVLSRWRDVTIAGKDIGSAMKTLRAKYPGAFIYCLQTTEFGTWIGASPEALVRSKNQRFSTVALAGTVPTNTAFGTKERIEHKVVIDSIADRLASFDIEIGPVEEKSYGDLKHLNCDITWSSAKDALYFARLLHPTPAVCGFPTDKAMNFIRSHEGYDRSLYTGYIGILETGQSDIFVNLRCAQVGDGLLRVFAGGGINELSSPSLEWDETERKMEAIIASIK
ncbi:MAG: hypothetical protein Kow0075_00960 [Salibacteraceae bacterium]